MKTIAVLVGSLRKDSINHIFAKALEKLSADQFRFHYIDMNMPLYNDDLWQSPPKSVTTWKETLLASDGVLIISPEYNRSVSPITKNAVDWASRPYGHNAWKGKPVTLTGASPGSQGTAVAQSQLRSTLVILETLVMGGPEVYLTFKPDMFDADFNVTNEGTAKFLKGYLDRFAQWVETAPKV